MEIAKLGIMEVLDVYNERVLWKINVLSLALPGARHRGISMAVRLATTSLATTCLDKHLKRSTRDTSHSGGAITAWKNLLIGLWTEDSHQPKPQRDRRVYHHLH